jgi:hypothetical protein
MELILAKGVVQGAQEAEHPFRFSAFRGHLGKLDITA